jgi:hypothetical protein
MINYTKENAQLKRYFEKFTRKFCVCMPFNHKQLFSDLIYGIAKSHSLHLSNIARALDEDILLNSIITRLHRNLKSEVNFSLYNKHYINTVKSLIDNDDLLVFVDYSDISKKYSYKLEDLDYVADGSNNHNSAKGYWLLEMVVLSKNTLHPITICSNLFSTKSEGFMSINDILYQELVTVISLYGNNITFVFDAGFDDIKLINLLNNLNVKFIIRGTNSRKFLYKNKKRTAIQVKAQCKGKINDTFTSKDKEKIDLKLSHIKVRLWSDKKTEVNTVVVKGFSKEDKDAMILLTNIDVVNKDTVKNIFWTYIKRWKIEEIFRLNKTTFKIEKMMVRKINAMQQLLNCVHILNLIGISRIEKEGSSLTKKIITSSKALRKDIKFCLYQIQYGLKIILSHSNNKIFLNRNNYKRKKLSQLSLF